jgi:hypothetical protein
MSELAPLTVVVIVVRGRKAESVGLPRRAAAPALSPTPSIASTWPHGAR